MKNIFLENTNSTEYYYLIVDFEQCHWFDKIKYKQLKYIIDLQVVMARACGNAGALRPHSSSLSIVHDSFHLIYSDLLVVRGRVITVQVTPAANLVTMDYRYHVIIYSI